MGKKDREIAISKVRGLEISCDRFATGNVLQGFEKIDRYAFVF